MRGPIPVLVLVGSISAACSGDSSGPGVAVNTFDDGTEGWTISGDAEEEATEPTYLESEGLPGGAIQGTDEVTGGTWYFEAPAAFLDAMSDGYEGSLGLDLRTSETTNPFDDADIVLVGAETTLTFDLATDPAIDWTHYVVPLSDGAGWMQTDTDQPPSAETFRRVLSAASRLRIRGEYSVGPDEGSLDNVRITEAR